MRKLAENDYLISSPEGLQKLLDRVPIEGRGRIALDTEADSLHSYREKLCLMQFSSGGVHAIIDPLSINGVGFEPLLKMLDTAEVWMHGADFDITMLKRRFDRVPERILDTQIAARLCGARQFGLANLIQQEFSLTLSKQSQRANWGKRPLLEKMVEYALNDVRYILPLADIYGERLKQLGRYEWFLESCSDARHVVMARPPRDAEEAWRISGSGKLRPMAMHFLRAVWHWRDGEAERLDRPAFKVISNEELIKSAEKMAAGEFPALPERFHSSAVRRFQKALRDASAQSQDQWPRRRQGIRTIRNQAADKRMEQYRAHRDKVAVELDLDPALIASRGVLETLAHHPEKAPELLLNWQRKLMSIIS